MEVGGRDMATEGDAKDEFRRMKNERGERGKTRPGRPYSTLPDL
jgi:hypothetical protein